jgi:hypothetical protein
MLRVGSMRKLQSQVMAVEAHCDLVMFWDWSAGSVWRSAEWFRRVRGGRTREGVAESAYQVADRRGVEVRACIARLRGTRDAS